MLDLAGAVCVARLGELMAELIFVGGTFDAPENAQEVAELLRGMRCKVNLIALNPGPGIDFVTPEEERVVAFQTVLRESGIPAFVRRPRGRDIFAACGQLKRTVEGSTSPARRCTHWSTVDWFVPFSTRNCFQHSPC